MLRTYTLLIETEGGAPPSYIQLTVRDIARAREIATHVLERQRDALSAGIFEGREAVAKVMKADLASAPGWAA